ncbi:MAG: hypothetical protein ACFFBH_04115 [Promethearchaeota archaeon]
MTENLELNRELSNQTKMIQILDRAVKLFEKTGLNDLAEKWNRILKNCMRREQLSDLM